MAQNRDSEVQRSAEAVDYLPISALAEFVYCPRNFYYRVAEGATEENHHVVKGRIQEENRDQRSTVTREATQQQRRVMVSSERLGLIGAIDAVEEGEEVYPVEYKKGAAGDKLHDRVQLCAQAMVLEEVLGRPVERGFIYYGESHQRVPVEFTDDLRTLVERTAEQARALLAANVVPEPVNDRRCQGCSLRERCLPEEVAHLRRGGAVPGRPVPGRNLGRVLYVDEPGAYVRRSGERLVVTKDDATLREVPAVNIDEVVLVGHTHLSSSAMRLLLERSIPVALLSRTGQFQGHLQPALSKNAPLRIAQVKRYQDPDFRLAVARAFVQGKLKNMRTLLLRHHRTDPDPAVAEAAAQIKMAIERAATAPSQEVLLGIEGLGSRHYWSGFRRILRTDLPFDFERRTRWPPTDPVNALLGFAYSLLSKEMASACALAGLDPYIGFYHGVKYGRPALALDLMEEFRPVVADSVVLTLLNRGMLGADDFDQQLQACYLSTAGRKRFYSVWEERRSQEVTHPIFGYRLPYRRVLELQARFMAKVIQNDLPEYRPFVFR